MSGRALVKMPYDAEIEYLESKGEYTSGTGIDLGIYGSMDLDFSIDFMPLEVSTEATKGVGSIFGARTNWNKNIYQLSTFNKSNISSQRGHFVCASNYGYSNNNAPWLGLVANQRCSISKRGLVFTRPNGTTVTLPSQTFTTPVTISVFSYHSTTTYSESQIKMRLYRLTFSRNSVVLRDLIPVRVGQVGYLYDKVSGQLFGYIGESDFILGPDKSN